MAVILVDSDWKHMCLHIIHQYQSHPTIFDKNQNISLLPQIIIQNYLLDKCVDYFQKLENRILKNFS